MTRSMYYIIVTCNTTGKTYFFVTDDIENGRWHCSTTDKCYDPGLLFEDTGTEMKKYVLHPADNFEDHAMYLREMKVDKDWNVSVGERTKIIDYANLENPARGLRAEGYHAYKIDGWYYVFMIQGKDGQRQEIVWCSRNLTDGPWEGRLVFGGEMVDADGNEVMHTNGIAQGGVVQAEDGRWWCFIFKDYGSLGRMPMLFPMTWSEDGWAVVGKNATAAPQVCDMPVKGQKMSSIAESDEFNVWKPRKSRSRFGSHEPGLKLCWQWNHIPDNDAWSLTQRKGWLRLTANTLAHNIRDARNTLTQRTFGPTCTGETLLDASGMTDGSRAGLASFQNRYGFVGVKKADGQYYLVMHRAMDKGDAEGKEIACIPLTQSKVWLRVTHDFRDRTDKARFFYSLDGRNWQPIGDTLQMYYDWPDFCGQRFALFHYATDNPSGHADFDYFHIGE